MKKIQSFLKNNYWLIIGVVLSFLLILLWFSLLENKQLRILFSSDALYLPSVYKDIFVDGNSFQGWTFNPAPNFFPDMLFFFILMGITSNFLTATFLFSIIQYFTIIFLIYTIFRNISSIKSSVFSLSLYLFSFFLLYFLVDKEFYYSFLIMSNSYHNGMFVMALVCTLLSILFFKRESWISLGALFLLIAISYPCDKLFAVAFICPILSTNLVLLITGFDKKKLFKLSITCVLGVLVGILILDKFTHNSIFLLTKPHLYFDVEAILSSWRIFSEQMQAYISELSFKSLTIILSMLSYIWTIYYCLSRFIWIKKGKDTRSLFFIFEIFVLFFVPMILLAPILSGNYMGFDVIRYNYYAFVILMFNLILLLNDFLEKHKIFVTITNSLASISMIIYLIFTITTTDFANGLRSYFTAYPEYAQNLDTQFPHNEAPVYGITDDYWYAKHATMFSKKDIRLYGTFDDATPSEHVSNKSWFYGGNDSKYGNPRFTFLLWSNDKPLPVFFVEHNPPYESRVADEKKMLYLVQPFGFDKGTRQPKLLK